MFEVPTELQKGNSLTELPVREVCILPFPMTDVLLQGETKELCLYEERFHNLFEKAIEEHAGVVAMGYIAPPNGMLQGMPLCEIESFTKMKGKTGFGNMSILATIRAVGRATYICAWGTAWSTVVFVSNKTANVELNSQEGRELKGPWVEKG